MKDLAPVLVMAVIFLPIIIKTLLNHQRQMAELMYRVNQQPIPVPATEQDQVQRDLQDLKQLVHQQAIAIDNLSTELDRMAPDSVQDRLTERAV